MDRALSMCFLYFGDLFTNHPRLVKCWIALKNRPMSSIDITYGGKKRYSAWRSPMVYFFRLCSRSNDTRPTLLKKNAANSAYLGSIYIGQFRTWTLFFRGTTEVNTCRLIIKETARSFSQMHDVRNSKNRGIFYGIIFISFIKDTV